MKKTFLSLLAVLSAVTLFGGGLRIDITGLPENVQPQDLMPANATCRTLNRSTGLQRSLTFPATTEWMEFSFSVTSPTACKLLFSFRGTDNYWVAIDDISADNTQLKNGTFEKINAKRGTPDWWKGTQQNLCVDMVKTGNYALKVAYKTGVSQSNIVIPANTKVTFKGAYRYLEAPKTNKGKSKSDSSAKKYPGMEVINHDPAKFPAGANVAYARPYDGERPLIVSVGRLEFRPTFENCGYYINLLPEEHKQKIRIETFFRKKGDKKFRKALNPAEVKQEHAWRGSLLMLAENTDYEFKAVITGDKGYKKELTGAFRTMNSNVPYETVVLPAGPMKTALKSGTADKYIRYTSNGKVVKAPDAGTLAVFNVEGLKYVIFDNMEIDAKGAQNAFLINNSSDIIVRNCDIYNFGREPGQAKYSSELYYSGGMQTKQGVLMYDNCAFRLARSTRILIERNYAHDPSFSAQTWLFAHPSGPGGVKAVECSNSVVRYNDFIGRNGARYIDQVISPPNGSFYGGIYRDGDYYGNSFLLSNDDGAEIEAGAMNTRCYGNRIEQVLSGISTGPITMGPTYLFGNLYTNPGDEDGTGGQPYKNGGGTDGFNWTRGMLFMMHNSVGDSWTTGYGVGAFSQPHKDFVPTLKAYLRNNILRTDGKFFHRRWPFMPTDCDGDLLERTAINPELVKMDTENIKVHNLEPNGIYAKADYVAAATGNYAIKANSPGGKKRFTVNNLEHYPQVGAYLGTPGEWFPKRPLDLRVDKTELHWLKGDDSVRKVTVTAGKTMRGKYKVHCNDKFFTVKPAAGEFVPGKSIEFTITLKAENMKEPRRYAGAFLVRAESGLGLPVTVYADRRTTVEKIVAQKDKFFVGKAVADKNKVTAQVAVPSDGVYFMMLDVEPAAGLKNARVKMTFAGLTREHSIPALGAENINFRLLKSAQKRRLEAFNLKKGVQKVLFTVPENVKIRNVIFTQVPWEAMRNRAYEVKSGK